MPRDLAARTLQLVDMASESRDEAQLAALVRATIPGARDAGDGCVLAGATTRGERSLVLLCGHLDTVPAQGNRPGSRDDRFVHGLGAADMKGGLAVMAELALADASARTVDLGFVFFGREELAHTESALTPLLEREPGLRTADLAIVLEPTANALQLGCLGNVNATWTFTGVSGHSARPWLADNAIHRAARAIAAMADAEMAEREYDGLRFREALSVTRIEGGIADNVVPDRAVAHLNHRYPPGVSAADAEARLGELCGTDGAVEVVSNSPSGPVPRDNPLVERLVTAGELDREPKQAWTPVAELGLAGIDAVNFGPGDPAFAHRRDERVEVAALERCHAVLERFACA